MAFSWDINIHWIGWREHLQESPIFHGKKACKKLKTMVSCRFSHQPIHLNMEYEKQPRDHSYGETRHDWDSDSPRNGSLKNRWTPIKNIGDKRKLSSLWKKYTNAWTIVYSWLICYNAYMSILYIPTSNSTRISSYEINMAKSHGKTYSRASHQVQYKAGVWHIHWNWSPAPPCWRSFPPNPAYERQRAEMRGKIITCFHNL